MSAAVNIVNPKILAADIQKIFKPCQDDKRVQSFVKRRVVSWMSARRDATVKILPGSALEVFMPDWAVKQRAEGADNFYYYTKTASAEDMLKHCADYIMDQLAAEKEANTSADASRRMEQLLHMDVTQIFNEAESYYESLNQSTRRASTRSRSDIFMKKDGEEDTDVEFHPSDENFIWRQVAPRGLKAVAVTLNNCLGGSMYASQVKSGITEVWVLCKNTSREDFSAAGDILVAASISTKNRQMTEVKKVGNQQPVEYVDQIEDFCSTKFIQPDQNFRSLSGATVRMSDIEAGYEITARSGTSFLAIDHLSAQSSEDGIFRSFSIGHDTGNGRAALERVASFESFDPENMAIVSIDFRKISSMFDDREMILALEDRLQTLSEGFQIKLRGPDHSNSGPILFGPASSTKKWTIASMRNAQKLPWEAFMANATGAFSFPLAGRELYISSADNMNMSLFPGGVVVFSDGDNTIWSCGVPEYVAAAELISSNFDTTKGLVSLDDWKSIVEKVKSDIDRDDIVGADPYSVNAIPDGDPGVVFLGGILANDDFGAFARVGGKPRTGFSGLQFKSTNNLHGCLNLALEPKLREVFSIDERDSFAIAEVEKTGNQFAVISRGGKIRNMLGEVQPGLRTLEFNGIENHHKGHTATFSINDLNRMIDSLSACFDDGPAVKAVEEYSKPFPNNIARDGRFNLATKNIGTAESPVIKLTKPVRFVGLLREHDGQDLNDMKVGWVARQSKSLLKVEYITGNGIEHLGDTAIAMSCAVSDEHINFNSLSNTIQKYGYSNNSGFLLKLSNTDAEKIRSKNYMVERKALIGGVDDRSFTIKRSDGGDQGGSFNVRSLRHSEDGKTFAQIEAYNQPKAAIAEAVGVAVEVINSCSLQLDPMTMIKFGIYRDQEGKFNVGNTRMDAPIQFGPDSYLIRSTAMNDMYYLGGASFRLVTGDGTELAAFNPAAGLRTLTAVEPTAKAYRACADFIDAYEAGLILDAIAKPVNSEADYERGFQPS
jgi:hypothetical protein